MTGAGRIKSIGVKRRISIKAPHSVGLFVIPWIREEANIDHICGRRVKFVMFKQKCWYYRSDGRFLSTEIK